MNKWAAWLGWIVAVVAVVAAGVFAVMAQGYARQAQALQERVATAEDHATTLTEDVATAAAKTKDFERRIALLEHDSRSAADKAAAVPAPAVTADETAPVAGEQAADNASSPLAAMFSGEKGKQMARMSADMAVNMQYADFFRDLNLPADAESQVKEILARNLSEQILDGVKAMQDKATPEVMNQMKQESDQRLRQELSTVLNADEMAAWEEYQATLPERTLRQSYDMQLTQFASGLTPEAHERTRDVLVEELLAAGMGNQSTGIPATSDVQTAMQAQRDSFARARDRLAQELDENQMAVVDQFFAQQANMIEASMQMFSGSQEAASTPAQ